jgi:hypothetical protein
LHSLWLFTVVVIPQDFYCINFKLKVKKARGNQGKIFIFVRKKNIRLQNLLALLIQHKKWMANAGTAYEKRFFTKTTTFRTVAIIVEKASCLPFKLL